MSTVRPRSTRPSPHGAFVARRTWPVQKTRLGRLMNQCGSGCIDFHFVDGTTVKVRLNDVYTLNEQ
jgi:hypothetical protein